MTRLARARRAHTERRAAPPEDQRFACSLPCPDGVDLIPLGRVAR